MKTECYIAKKYITERKRQSLISVVGIALGVAVLTVSIAIANGLNDNLITNILSVTSHAFIGNYGRIEDYRELAATIEQIPGVKGAVPAIETQGIVKHTGPYGLYAAGVRIEGYDLGSAEKAMDLKKRIVEGEILPDKIDGILLGRELQKITGAKTGDTVTIISSENREIDFTLTGIFQSGYYDYDVNMVILPLTAAQYLMQSGDCTNRINIMLKDPYKAPAIAAEVAEATGKKVVTWGEVNRNLLQALSLEKTVMILVFSLIVVIAGFVVWVTLNNLVREKIRDIGILRAMGYPRGSVTKIFLLQGLILGIAGIAAGLGVSWAVLSWLKHNSLSFVTSVYYLTRVPVVISAREVLLIAAANLVVILFSSVLPARRAGKLNTVEALRYE
ncbi:MAG: ABC transporter permease [Fusobacteriaceae bacterium]|jgi:lipoprotein-releasing system permease protein|nr:ABC transporter permease [Fusobacteriaceae bacterium]